MVYYPARARSSVELKALENVENLLLFVQLVHSRQRLFLFVCGVALASSLITSNKCDNMFIGMRTASWISCHVAGAPIY